MYISYILDFTVKLINLIFVMCNLSVNFSLCFVQSMFKIYIRKREKLTMKTIELQYVNGHVYYNNTELRINKQASKGPGNEVIDLSRVPEARELNRKWLSLSKLHEGSNTVTLEATNRTQTTSNHEKDYILNSDEQAQINELNAQIATLQAQIDAIIENAKSRYVSAPESVDVTQLSDEQLKDYLARVEKYLAQVRSYTK